MAASTYYDTLQIARNANDEVIRAAYRALSQKHHPDRNPGDQERATARMQRLNEAYEVLSDPARRRAYDQQVDDYERSRAASQSPSANPPTAPAPRPSARHAKRGSSAIGRLLRTVGTVFVVVLAGVIGSNVIHWASTSSTPSASTAISYAPPAELTLDQRSVLAAADSVEARYPLLDPKSPSYNQFLVDRIADRMKGYIAKGVKADIALRMAADEIMAPSLQPKPQPKPVQQRSPAQIQKKPALNTNSDERIYGNSDAACRLQGSYFRVNECP